MYSIKRIVTATDMSPFAARAEERAARLVHELESESLTCCMLLIIFPWRHYAIWISHPLIPNTI